MSKTKRNSVRREYEGRPFERHIARIRCEGCREWFPEEEVEVDRDRLGRVIGRFCEGCI